MLSLGGEVGLSHSLSENNFIDSHFHCDPRDRVGGEKLEVIVRVLVTSRNGANVE